MLSNQIAHLTIGKNGCYFLSLLRLAEMETGEKQNDLEAYYFCVSQGWMKQNCYVQNPDRILSYYTRTLWSVRHEPTNYFPRENEREILRWENDKTPMHPLAHFVIGNGLGVTLWDPSDILTDEWRLVSKRIFRRKE